MVDIGLTNYSSSLDAYTLSRVGTSVTRRNKGKGSLSDSLYARQMLIMIRLAWFYLISAGIGGFSSILAYGIIQMEGVGGVRGWQWIFVGMSFFVQDLCLLLV